MIFANEAYKNPNMPKEYLEGFVKMIYPFAPHMGEEMWQFLGHKDTITYESWPTFDEQKTAEEKILIVVQINGKIRDKIEASPELSKEELEKLALDSPKVKQYLDGKQPKKIIVVPNKLVSIVL